MESCNLGGATVHLSDEVRLRLRLAGLLDKCQGAPATSYRMLPASHKEMAIDTEEYTETVHVRQGAVYEQRDADGRRS